MEHENLRPVLDDLGDEELLRLRQSVSESPDGSVHDIGGVQVTKDRALQLINQALPVDES